MTIPASALMRSAVFAGLVNQAVVSLGNFGLNLLLARALMARDYGAFSVFLSVFLFLNAIHQSLVTYPLSVRGAAAGRGEFRRLIGAALALTIVLQCVFVPAIAGAAASIRQWQVVPAALLALVLWQFQEVYRRALIARGFYGPATLGDGVRYLGAFFLVLALIAAGGLSLERVILTIAAASALAAASTMAIAPHWLVPTRPRFKAELKTHWRMGSAYLVATLLAMFSSQWFLWLLAWQHGLAATAALQALVNIAAIAAPIMFGIENVMVPDIARRRDALRYPALIRLLRRRALIGAGLITPFFAIAFAAPEWTIRFLYGTATPYAGFGTSLRVLIAAYAAIFVSVLFAATLRAYVAKEGVLMMQLYPAILSISLGSWLVLEFGLIGACTAALLAGLLRAVLGFYYVYKIRHLTRLHMDLPALDDRLM